MVVYDITRLDYSHLTEALAEKRIRGAGLDVMDPEPIEPDDPLLQLENVLLTPHALVTTDEMLQLCGDMCVAAALAVMRGQVPDSVINPDVLDNALLKQKLQRYGERYGATTAPALANDAGANRR